MNPLDAVLQLEAAGVGGGGAGVARVVRQLGEGGPVVAPQQQHAAGGGPGHVVLPVILKYVCPSKYLQCIINRVERDDKRRPKTYAVREQFSLFLVCWVETEKFLFLLFESGFDDAMNMENDNINNSLECLEMS